MDKDQLLFSVAISPLTFHFVFEMLGIDSGLSSCTVWSLGNSARLWL